jgi:hypothetical protein
LTHIDSDELIYSQGAFKEILANVSQDVQIIVMLTLESFPQKEEYSQIFLEENLFKIPSKSLWKNFLAKKLGCQALFQNGYIKGHSEGKSIVRTNASIKQVKIHRPKPTEGIKLKTVVADNLSLLHFDCCGFMAWKNKWLGRYDGSCQVNQMRHSRVKQLKEFAKVYEENQENIEDIKKLYKKLYFMSNYQKFILKKLGLLKIINLPASFFLSTRQGSNVQAVETESTNR